MKPALALIVPLLAASPALAALGGVTGVVIPYAGKLEQNGAVVTGSFDFEFQVMPDGSTATPCETKTVSAVAVTNGEFALTIPALSEACVKNKDVHLIVGVRTAGGGGGFTTLGKQRMTPTLSALTSGTGDFNAGGQVQGSTASFNSAVINSATVNGALTSGSISTGPISTGSNNMANDATLTLNTSVFFPWTLQVRTTGRLMFSGFGDRASIATDGIRTVGTFTANTTPDIAETIAAATNVEAADVVCADPKKAEHVVRCPANAHGVLGVVSDGTSSFMINSNAHVVEGPLTGAPLVLAGRVPVKVSLENGPIHIGDELALSSTPGVAMRAIEPGPTVGIALADFSGDGKQKTGTVLCFVKVSEGNPALERKIAELEARLKALEPPTKQAAR